MKPSRQSAVRRAKYSGKRTFNIEADTSDLQDYIASLDASVEQAIRPAAQAAAEVLYRAAVQNVAKLGAVTGNLRESIYQAFSEEHSVKVEAGYASATYHISWNAKVAPHGHLIEHGHLQRYAVHLGADGKWYTLKRPESRGKKKPGRKASQAVKDAYYVLRQGGPVQVPARPFVRAAAAFFPQAIEAAKQKIFEAVDAA